MAALADRVPVTVLTGFLGSGKTTLLNYILRENHGLKVAVIENEFGEVGVDDALVKKKFDTAENVFEMNNGCVCCTVRGDLIKVIGKLLRRKAKLDAIIIETTGLADPAPVAQTFFMDEEIKAKARLDGIITVVDAKHIVMHLDEVKPEGAENEAVEQVAFADRLLMNKCDLVSSEELAEAESRVRQINKTAKMSRCTNSEVPLEEVLGINGFELSRVLEMDPEFLALEEDEAAAHGHGHGHGHGEGGGCSGEAACSHESHGKTKKKHQHDTRVKSVGIREVGVLNMELLNNWISTLLQTNGKDIYRMKGIFAIEDMPFKFVFQGVHMQFNGQPMEDAPWGKDEVRENRCIFIGKNLNEEELRASFTACLVVQPNEVDAMEA